MKHKDLYIEAIKSIIDHYNDALLMTPIASSDIDSIDLVTIRVDVENLYGESIPDNDWIHFKTLQEIIDYCTKDTAAVSTLEDGPITTSTEKHFSLNMPQMAIEALSENWLFKELGDFHWELLCEGLDTNSFALKDDMGNRLYATFVRIRISFPVSISEFQENEKFKMVGHISRYGNGMYFSEINSSSAKGNIKAELMTSFSIRNNVDNTKLMKSQPAPGTNHIESLDAFPKFGDDYRLVKKGVQKMIEGAMGTFEIVDDVLFSKEYLINPFYDLNGVGLLYFAAYPIINDVSESSYFTNLLGKRWETAYSTIFRDIFYFANCNINDVIEYKLHSVERIDDDKIKISSSLFRKNDNVLMARIFTVKKERK